MGLLCITVLGASGTCHNKKLSLNEGAEATGSPSDFFRTIEPLKKVSLQGRAQVTKTGAGQTVKPRDLRKRNGGWIQID